MSAFYGKQHKRSALLFYCIVLAFPVAQFCIFYIGVNFNSIRLAFGDYNLVTGDYKLIGFSNFVRVVKMFVLQAEMRGAVYNSLIVYAVNLAVGIPLGLLFSYYIFREMRGYKLFKIMLFLPSILSAMTLAIFFNYFTDRAIPFLIEKLFHTKVMGIISNRKTQFAAMLFFMVFVGFGAMVLMYVGAMNNISESVLESARIDGASPLREFISIVIPMVYPTIVTFAVVQTAGIFTNQLNLYAFFGASASYSVYTMGYYIFQSTNTAVLGEYPGIAALGILCTLIAVPLTLGVRKLMERLGPSVEA